MLEPTENLASKPNVLLLVGLAVPLVLINFLVGNGYGFHRDELQFLDDARHLRWGFVAYPPLTSFCGRAAIALFGVSPQIFRLPAALVNAMSLILSGLTARELGGKRAAQTLAVLAVFPAALAFSSVLQYNTFDLFAWSLLIYFTARVLRTSDERNWLGAGLGIGLGVLSKYSIALPVFSLLAALALLPSQRHHLRSRWFWCGGAIALLLAAPNLVWLASHHFITLRMESFIHARDVRMGRANGYFTDQLKFTLLGLPLAVAGLVSLVRSRRFRLLSAFYLGPFVLFALLRGRGYYLLPAYPVLYAAGAAAVERRLTACRRWQRAGVRAVLLTALLANTALVAAMYLPVWKPGTAGWNWQMQHSRDLADEVGWPEFVDQVAAVRDTLTPQERGQLGVLANNYGEAGALELYGPVRGLPTAISSTNSFHERGFGSVGPETVIVTGSNLAAQMRNFETCRVAAIVHMPFGVRNEESADHPEILVCHHLRIPWPQAWAKSQAFG